MATGPFVFNVAKGGVAHYARLPLANDALILVWLLSTGLEADAVLQDYANLSVLLAATNDEMTFPGYTRRTLTGITTVADNTANAMTVDAADPASYTNTGTAQVGGAAIVCYDPDTTVGTDADLIPLVQLLTGTTTFDTNIAVTAAFNVAGLFSAT